VNVEHAGVEGRRFAQDLETAAYRIVQEALTNVARHAQAGQATVRLWADESLLRAQVEDHGIGFDPAAALRAGHTGGLAGMRERAGLAGGRLYIESEPGRGARLTVELPLGAVLERRANRP
jgi:signal transduction histidine kinase